MAFNKDTHYCKHCNSNFAVKIDEDECGDLLLECPGCMRLHPRRFKDGVAVSCDVDYNKARKVTAC